MPSCATSSFKAQIKLLEFYIAFDFHLVLLILALNNITKFYNLIMIYLFYFISFI